MPFQSLLDDLDSLLPIPGHGVDTRKIGVVIDIVELQLDGPLAEIDGRLDLPLHHSQAQPEVRETSGGLGREHRRRRIPAAVDVEKQRQSAEVLFGLRERDRFVDAFDDSGHQSNSRERSRCTKRSMRPRSSSLAALKLTAYFAVPP